MQSIVSSFHFYSSSSFISFSVHINERFSCFALFVCCEIYERGFIQSERSAHKKPYCILIQDWRLFNTFELRIFRLLGLLTGL